MLRITKLCIFSMLLAAAFIAIPVLSAQHAKDVSPAPVPVQILAAKKVFVSNGGGDNGDSYSGGPGRSYNQFYTALKSWGRYELVAAPADADLIFEITFANPIVAENASGGSVGIPVTSSPVRDGRFRLRIVDLQTHVLLWAITEHVEPAKLQGNRDKNFDQAMAILVNGLKNIAGQPTTAAEAAKK